MFPCLWKKYLHIECMGCGFQRSVVLLFQGQFEAAFYMYPAVYTLLVLFGFLILHLKFKFKYGAKILLALFVTNIAIIVINYILKFI
ncbi:MAG: DUF2752 domain-containing protein [Bacteroidia bacterium]|nr:DUF2752 domain-containing protein [Bacteroidia bacterium]MBT8269300.1 DUF2752 domain-containing protein [Bacteroidia bacterium]NNF82434.1 DUF2752 domain-containing protein [Flavobacteriaceae bacterium]NNK69762.1 DUF2752 domain-containing protein [Flavobacteriaceae bacterium]NNL80192.1 DUF2752 domain-containing protein [Flavobacteriaceae bacterium]